MTNDLINDSDYREWVIALKAKFRHSQLKAVVAVNSILLEFYWDLGSDMIEKQKARSWGDGFLSQLSKDLMADFPETKGFSKRNLEQIRRWYRFWNLENAIAKQPASQLMRTP